MIEQKQLRIGNYVCNSEEPKEMIQAGFNPFFKVDTISKTGINATTIYDEDMDSESVDYTPFVDELKFDQLLPITLTPEILEKCGFNWNQHWLEKDLKFCNWWLRFSNGRYDHLSIFQYQNADRNESTVNRIDFGRNRPEYLHQLQNLYFALTGEEFKIEL